MPNYLKFNFSYDNQALLAIFNGSEKTAVTPRRNKAILPAGIATSPELQTFFTRFPFIQLHDDSVEIAELTTDSLPRVYSNSNGSLIFPISGELTLKTYEFKFADPTSTWAYAIKRDDILTPTMIRDIESTLLETVSIDSPIVLDGQTTHSFQTNGAVVLKLHIPLSVIWEDVLTALAA